MIFYTSSEQSRTRKTPIHNASQICRRFTWLICASISLFSARYLLVERNVHYPLQLYFNQLVVTGFTALRPYWRWNIVEELPLQKPPPWRRITRGEVLVTASMCLTSLSTISTLQAILHFQNLPTLVMLILIALFAENVLIYFICPTSRTRLEFLRINLLVVASAGILFTEYRLTVPGLAAAIPAMLLAGVSRALWKTVLKYHPDTVADDMNVAGRYVIMGALMGMIWVLVFTTDERIFALDLGKLPLLVINALASASALTLGKSVLLPMEDDTADTASLTVYAPVNRIWDALTLVLLVGITGCYSSLSIRRSYANVYQFCCFFFAIIYIGITAYIHVFDSQLQKSWSPHSAHELINVSLEPLAEDSDANSLNEAVDNLETSALPSSSHNKSLLWILLFGVSIALLWTAYGVLNSIEQKEHRGLTLLDRAYVPQSSVEIVLSMYNEPVDEVNILIYNLKSMPALSDANVTIYVKNSATDIADLKKQTNADNIITLTNMGREGETYLNHILNRWDSLARQTIFLQANIHNPSEFYTHISNYYSRFETGFLNLGWSGAVCNCQDCGDKLFWQDHTHFLPQVHSWMYNSTSTCNNVLLSYKGQFIVSAARIRGIDKDIYRSLWEAFVDENSWAHQPEYLQGRPDSLSAPDFGYTMERMWNLLFQCSNREVAWKCPSLISKWRIGGDIGDCQCFDE